MKIYYNVHNCGDGSVRVNFFDSEELADWDEEHQYEGWGESCASHIEVESKSPIVCEDVKNKLNYLVRLFDDESEYLDEFIQEFFKEGVPKFDVDILDENYYGIYVKGDKTELIGKNFSYPSGPSKDGRAILEFELNNMGKNND